VTTVDVLDATGNKAGTVELPAEIFDVQVNIPLIHQVVVAQQAAARQGSHSTKSRGEVAGGGRKPYRQKGTGRARQGSIRAPQFAGGGVVHGPTPHDYVQRTPKKMKAAALRGALSDRARDGRVHIVEGLVDGGSASTKAAIGTLAKITSRPRTLVVLERGDDLTWLSLRNVDTVHVLSVDQLNTYDVLVSDDVVFIKAAYDVLVGDRTPVVGHEHVPASTDAADASADETQADVVDSETADVATPDSEEVVADDTAEADGATDEVAAATDDPTDDGEEAGK
jgi:large subunit ribosomal protein L4